MTRRDRRHFLAAATGLAVLPFNSEVGAQASGSVGRNREPTVIFLKSNPYVTEVMRYWCYRWLGLVHAIYAPTPQSVAELVEAHGFGFSLVIVSVSQFARDDDTLQAWRARMQQADRQLAIFLHHDIDGRLPYEASRREGRTAVLPIHGGAKSIIEAAAQASVVTMAPVPEYVFTSANAKDIGAGVPGRVIIRNGDGQLSHYG